MLANVTSRREAVLDARPAGRFEGTAPEPRPGLPSGHIPGSASMPFGRLLTEDGALKPVAEMAALLREGGWGRGDGAPAVATCGSGVTACILAWAAAVAGVDERVAVYDGSWTEWAGRGDTPKATK
jgi:thiosulfate/3-mercaptopyruvate sulfurtransferase